MKKLLTERFQELAGIKSLGEQENRPHPTDIFSDEELDYVGDMMVAMYEKLGLADEEDPSSTNVVKALALSDFIEGFFETLN